MKKKKKHRNPTIITTVTLLAVIAVLYVYRNDWKVSPAPCSKKDGARCDLTINKIKISAEIAYTDLFKARGLMFRKSLKRNTGMLFIYDPPKILTFWMKNTIIPLSIAYISSSGKIIDILEMVPQGETPEEELAVYPSTLPAAYALEMNTGWFTLHGIREGDLILIPKELRITTDETSF